MTVRIGSAVALGLLLLSSGCRSKPAPVPPPAGPLEFDDDPKSAAESPASDVSEHRDVSEGVGGCKAGGTAWDGKHEGCLYEVAGCCYPHAKAACTAAGCGANCQILESAPAQIVCRAG